MIFFLLIDEILRPVPAIIAHITLHLLLNTVFCFHCCCLVEGELLLAATLLTILLKDEVIIVNV